MTLLRTIVLRLLTTAITLFGAGVLLSYTFMYGHFGPAGQNYTFDGPGLSQLTAYLTIVVLACLGYGSVFLALSLVFKNPIPRSPSPRKRLRLLRWYGSVQGPDISSRMMQVMNWRPL